MKKGLLIYQRIIIIQFISIFIIMAILGIESYNSSKNEEINMLSTNTNLIKERLSSSLSIPLWNIDTRTCSKLLTQEMKNKYVQAIVINQDGKFYMGRIKSGEDSIEDIKDINEHNDVLKKSYAVKKDTIVYEGMDSEKEIGELVLYITDSPINKALSDIRSQSILKALVLIFIINIITYIILKLFLNKPLKQITHTASRIAKGEMGLRAYDGGTGEIATLANAFNAMTGRLEERADIFKKTNDILTEIINKAKEIILNLNSSSKEIEAAAQEQTSGATEQASGITEVSATLEELSITAKQITKNVGDLVVSSEDVTKLLEENENKLMDTVSQLENVGDISKKNAAEIGKLGERSELINDMVTLIKSVANKTDMLSINASIEASKDKKAGKGFRVIAAEIRQLSQKTIESAKEVEKTAKEIQEFMSSIVSASENEAKKVIESGKVVKNIYEDIESIVAKINDNFSFTQKIDVSIKQQESGSKQAADTMKQMSDIARQSAESARETSVAVNDIVNMSNELELIIERIDNENTDEVEAEISSEPEKDIQINKTALEEQEDEDYYNIIDADLDALDNEDTFLSRQIQKVSQLSGKYYNMIRSRFRASDNSQSDSR